jgi:hypothetical protein
MWHLVVQVPIGVHEVKCEYQRGINALSIIINHQSFPLLRRKEKKSSGVSTQGSE